MTRRAKIVLYALVVFGSAAALMVIEIVAGRLLAPYIGVSLYTWTSIIGVILAGLSTGNWLGGLGAERGMAERGTGAVLLAAAAWCTAALAAVPVLAGRAAEGELSLLAAGLGLSAALFFVPALLIGIVTPVLTTLSLALDERTGRIVGRLHALAALGAIAGTFATGFGLVQWFGTYTVVLGTAAALALMGVALLLARAPRRRHLATGAVAAVVLGLLATAHGAWRAPCDSESAYYCIRVVDYGRDTPAGGARAMVLDHLLHSINHARDPTLLVAPYVHAVDELARSQLAARGAANRSYFFAGGGGYTLPRAVLAARPRAEVVVAELDPLVTAVAARTMYVDTGAMRVEHGDARRVLRAERGRFDAVFVDVFHDVAVPFHLVTREFFALVHTRLAADGLALMNVVDAFPDPRLVKSVLLGLDSLFGAVAVYVEHVPDHETRVTYVVAARRTGAWPAVLHASTGVERTWYRIDDAVRAIGTPMAELTALTDDYAPVERLLAGLLLGANR